MIATPNVEVEVPIGKRWSIMGKYWFPWYVWGGNSKAYELLYGGLEGRCWLGSRHRRDALCGHFLGLYAGGGKYDLEWDSQGYQGEFFLAAGLSYGYARRLNRSLRLKFNLGVGYMRTGYRRTGLDGCQRLGKGREFGRKR